MTTKGGRSKDKGASTQAPEIHYIKGNFFRVVHADGAYGGTTPSANINIAFYSERPAIPRVTKGDEVVETRGGIVRELETNVVMDINTAINLYRWLGGRLEHLRDRLSIPDEDWDKLMNPKDG